MVEDIEIVSGASGNSPKEGLSQAGRSRLQKKVCNSTRPLCDERNQNLVCPRRVYFLFRNEKVRVRKQAENELVVFGKSQHLVQRNQRNLSKTVRAIIKNLCFLRGVPLYSINYNRLGPGFAEIYTCSSEITIRNLHGILSLYDVLKTIYTLCHVLTAEATITGELTPLILIKPSSYPALKLLIFATCSVRRKQENNRT